MRTKLLLYIPPVFRCNNITLLVLSHKQSATATSLNSYSPFHYLVRLEYCVVYRIYLRLLNRPGRKSRGFGRHQHHLPDIVSAWLHIEVLSDKMEEKGELYSCDQHHYILLTKFPQSHDWLAQKTSTLPPCDSQKNKQRSSVQCNKEIKSSHPMKRISDRKSVV